MNSSFIVLIPKIVKAKSIVDQYIPVALFKFIFKIIRKVKVIANRLGPIAQRIVLRNQFDFIRGRQVSHAILLTSECVKNLDKKCFGGNIGLKINIRKAFNKVSWDFRSFEILWFSCYHLFLG